MKKILRFGLSCLLFTGGIAALGIVEPTPTLAQVGSSTADSRVKAILDKADLKYDVISSGRYRIVMGKIDNTNRSQVVFINSATERYGNMEIREVWSPAYRTNGPLSETIANQLLVNSFTTKLGAWSVITDKATRVAVYTVKMAADADEKSLLSAILITVRSADQMEKELTGTDDF